jgi:hypothetical protein
MLGSEVNVPGGNFLLNRILDTVGNGTGTKNAIGNYLGAGLGETVFKIAPPADEAFRIHRMLVHIRDTGAFAAEEYANIAALATGVKIATFRDTTEITDLTDGLPIKTNAEWGRLCYDVLISEYGVGDEFLHARWTFSKFSSGLWLNGDESDSLQVILNDDFSTLVEHQFVVQGVNISRDQAGELIK